MADTSPTRLRHTKMRGGLGRTLLTAFLVLTLGPLSIMSLYAIHRTQSVEQTLTLQQASLLAEGYRVQVQSGVGDTAQAGDPLASEQGLRIPPALNGRRLYLEDAGGFQPLERDTSRLPDDVSAWLRDTAATAGAVPAPLSWAGAVWARSALDTDTSLLVVLPQETQSAVPEGLAATLVATALVVALVTTVAAAFITRQITRPLYELTQSAVKIAQGDVTRRANVVQENELGILALAFNTMTDQLQESLQTLEQRVEERTEQLRVANAEIANRARQLEVGAEIGKAISAIHELEPLLSEGCQQVRDDLGYSEVSLWLVGRRYFERRLTLRAIAPHTAHAEHQELGEFVETTLQQDEPQPCQDYCTVAFPLRIADNRIGVMVVRNTQPFAPEDYRPLQIMADTFAVAIENARAAEVEHEALLKLKKLEEHRNESLGLMSQELSTSLNTIIGYSGLLLRERSGPLTDVQRTDLSYINRNGVQLLSLLDGVLELIDDSTTGDEPQLSGE